MPWPDSYRCPYCGAMISRPDGARVWGCACSIGPSCQCRFLDAYGCYRCGTKEGFPQHKVAPLSDNVLNRTVLLRDGQTAQERDYTKKELNEKRRVYCHRCFHEQGFLRYSDTEITCLLCAATGPRGATLTHVGYTGV